MGEDKMNLSFNSVLVPCIEKGGKSAVRSLPKTSVNGNLEAILKARSSQGKYFYYYSYFHFWIVRPQKKSKGRELKKVKIHKHKEKMEGEWNVILLFRKPEKFQKNIYSTIVKQNSNNLLEHLFPLKRFSSVLKNIFDRRKERTLNGHL